MGKNKLPRYRVQVEENQRKSHVDFFICHGVSALAASKELFRHPFFLFQAGYIGHLGVEFLAKALQVNRHGYYDKVHNVIKILKDSNAYNQCSDEVKKALIRTDHLFNLRYEPCRDYPKEFKSIVDADDEFFGAIVSDFDAGHIRDCVDYIIGCLKDDAILVEKIVTSKDLAMYNYYFYDDIRGFRLG